MFTPGTSGNIHPNGFTGSSVNVYATIHALDPRAASEAVIQAIRIAQRSGMTQLAA